MYYLYPIWKSIQVIIITIILEGWFQKDIGYKLNQIILEFKAEYINE